MSSWGTAVCGACFCFWMAQIWDLSRGTQLPEGRGQRDIKPGWTYRQLAQLRHIQHDEFMTSSVYIRTRMNTAATRNSMVIKCKQCVPSALCPPPTLHLEMRLGGPYPPTFWSEPVQIPGGCCTLSTRWCRAEIYADIKHSKPQCPRDSLWYLSRNSSVEGP